MITELISISVFEGFLFLAEFLLWYWNISDSIELLDNLHWEGKKKVDPR